MYMTIVTEISRGNLKKKKLESYQENTKGEVFLRTLKLGRVQYNNVYLPPNLPPYLLFSVFIFHSMSCARNFW